MAMSEPGPVPTSRETTAASTDEQHEQREQAQELPPALPLQEALSLVKLPLSGSGETRRFISRRAAYRPGCDFGSDFDMSTLHANAFGGHVYAQAAIAAARVYREVEREKGIVKEEERSYLHVCFYFFYFFFLS